MATPSNCLQKVLSKMKMMLSLQAIAVSQKCHDQNLKEISYLVDYPLRVIFCTDSHQFVLCF